MPKHEIEMPPNGELKFWWALAWRQLLGIPAAGVVGGGVGGIIGLIFGFLGAAIGMRQDTVIALLRLAGGVLGFAIRLLINFLLVKDILGREFNGYVLAFVPGDQLACGKSGPASRKKCPSLSWMPLSIPIIPFLKLRQKSPSRLTSMTHLWTRAHMSGEMAEYIQNQWQPNN